MQKLFAFALAWLAVAPAAAQTGLTEAPRLAAVYDGILSARFSEAREALARACPPAPVDACKALRAAATWWEIQMDPGNRTLDRQLEREARAAIADAERWTRREPNRAEAWFYFAGSHGPLMEWMVLRGERLSAARSATTIKTALERTLALDPSLLDAYVGIGLYHYVADVAPTFLKLLRWLLLMPGGDRVAGLGEMLRGRDGAVLLKGEADYQLHFLYLWYEHQPARALELLTRLDTRYPSNPLFLARIAEVQRDYLHDRDATRAAWQTLFDRATTARVALAPMTETRARLGLADVFIEAAQPRRAVELLEPIVRARPPAPYGAESRAHLSLGRAYERLDDRDRATTAYRAAISTTPVDDPDDIRSRAGAGLARVRSKRR